MNKELITEKFRFIQDSICQGIESVDGKAKFQTDLWDRPEGGGGRTRIIQQGDLIEKGGVNFSAVHGPVSETMRKQLNLQGDFFTATGVSIVLHPSNPHVPIIHMNIRYFELNTGEYWFGGGIDLTPHFIVPEMAQKFHQGIKQLCDAYHIDAYQNYKKWADEYFYLPHRNETRGIGGIFFDHLKENKTIRKSQIFDFCCAIGLHFVEIYSEQVKPFRNKPFTEQEVKWRNIRRGRYVEFNLIYDRGTTFGLKTGGRTESILMSLPSHASWDYDYSANEKEKETLEILRKPQMWI
jgi:coproporphyrinogen III oxidase